MADGQMTQTPTLTYFERITRVQAHIRDHLDDPLDLDTLADVACLSRFHWHRVYRAMTGETATQTVKRMRMNRAANDLAQSELAIADVAARAGYSSEAAFNRAFAAMHGKPPASFRTTGAHIALQSASKANNPLAFSIEIRDLPARPALTLPHTGPYMEIGTTFGELFLTLQGHGLMDRVEGCLGMYTQDPGEVADADLRSQACVFIAPGTPPVGDLTPATIGGGAYAVLLYKGPYSAMYPAYEWLFGTWLPQSQREARNAPVLEINLNTPDTTPPSELLTEICLPLEG